MQAAGCFPKGLIRMKKIISAGHICLDITPVFPSGHSCGRIGDLLVPGRLIRTESASVHTGGSVANTGLALKLLGNGLRAGDIVGLLSGKLYHIINDLVQTSGL